jgi:hypothetical protein
MHSILFESFDAFKRCVEKGIWNVKILIMFINDYIVFQKKKKKTKLLFD